MWLITWSLYFYMMRHLTPIYTWFPNVPWPPALIRSPCVSGNFTPALSSKAQGLIKNPNLTRVKNKSVAIINLLLHSALNYSNKLTAFKTLLVLIFYVFHLEYNNQQYMGACGYLNKKAFMKCKYPRHELIWFDI